MTNGVLLLLLSMLPQSPAEEPFDLLLTGGRVIDGTGNPWFPADVGVRNGRIVAIGTRTSPLYAGL